MKNTYTITMLVSKEGGTHVVGAVPEMTVMARNYKEAVEMVSELVEKDGWKADKPLFSVKHKKEKA